MYNWSSYKEYIGKKIITDTDYILSMYGEKKDEAIRAFKEFTCCRKKKMTINEYKDYEITRNISDYEANNIIKEILNIDNLLEIKKYNTQIRNEYIKRIFQIEGTTIRQLSRLLGIDIKTLSQINRNRQPVPNVEKNQHWEASPKEVQNG